MGRSLGEFLDETRSIAGFLKTTWETDPVGPDHVAAVSVEDGKKIIDGYACGNSRCFADYGGIYRVVCPVCGFDRRIETPDRFMVPVPPEWEAYMRYRDQQITNPTRTPLIDMEETLRRVMGDPDVEHTTLSKLKRRRK